MTQEAYIEISKVSTITSSQQDDTTFSGIDGVVQPRVSPDTLIFAYDRSFALSGIASRIARACASGFVYPEGMDEISKRALESIDLEHAFLSMFITGNAYIEKLRATLWEKVISFASMYPQEMRVRRNSEGIEYIQSNWTKKVTFEASKVVHAKELSISSRYYGESKSSRCIDQIALLGHIDSYYSQMFENGFFRSKIIVDTLKQLTDDQKSALKASIDDRMRGNRNAFSSVIIGADIKIEDLDSATDTTAFLAYREQLIRSIAIALCIPVDIIMPEGSSRATMGSSMDQLNRDIITPLQDRLLSALKSQITEVEIPGISKVKFYPVETKNAIDDMKVATWYVQSGILSPNEARKRIGYEPVVGGDGLERSNPTPQDQTSSVLKTIETMYAE